MKKKGAPEHGDHGGDLGDKMIVEDLPTRSQRDTPCYIPDVTQYIF